MIKSKGVKLLSGKSVRRIRRMIAAVLAEPELYDQNTFGENKCIDEGAEICGTVCCAAGWAVWLYNREMYDRMIKGTVRNGGFYEGRENWPDQAMKALGLEASDADDGPDRLFGTASDWPYPFFARYRNATTPKQRAKVFAARWEKFISSDGQV